MIVSAGAQGMGNNQTCCLCFGRKRNILVNLNLNTLVQKNIPTLQDIWQSVDVVIVVVELESGS